VYVLATAGHVDHGKSTLVRALTGTDPDRLPEEHRRGLTIELGFAWTDLPSGERVAFVDVPGHERFVSTMLAGVGAVPAVLLVVAADEGWRPQTAEHVAILNALGVSRGILAITRSDLADPAPATAEATARLADTSLAGLPAFAVSSSTGQGLPELRAALDAMLAAIPNPKAPWRTRLFVDRVFTAHGSGTVVTGTLAAGALRVGDQVLIGDNQVGIRALESCWERYDTVAAPARVAVNLRGASRAQIRRGDALVSPGDWWPSEVIDVELSDPVEGLPPTVMFHIGAAAVPARTRVLAGSGGRYARLHLTRALPLEPGDRVVLRDAGRRARGIDERGFAATGIVGAVVRDIAPPPLERRGAARARTEALDAGYDARAAIADRPGVSRAELHQLGWLAPVDALPPGVAVHDGALYPQSHHPEPTEPPLPPQLLAAGAALRRILLERPFQTPPAADLQVLGLDPPAAAALARAGAIIRLPGEILLLPDALDLALGRLAALDQPFSVGEAARALDTSRRVAVPILEELDRSRRTRRNAEGLRTVR
jgi:selenocysteine-specific elongation factor